MEGKSFSTILPGRDWVQGSSTPIRNTSGNLNHLSNANNQNPGLGSNLGPGNRSGSSLGSASYGNSSLGNASLGSSLGSMSLSSSSWSSNSHGLGVTGSELLSNNQKRPDVVSPSRSDVAFHQYQQGLRGNYQPPPLRVGNMPPASFQMSNDKLDMQKPSYVSAGSTLDSRSTASSDFNAEDAQAVVASLKEQIEVLITAMMMQDTPSSGISKGVDAVEVSHRVMSRLTMLREENKRLAELANGQAAAHLQAQNALLVRENELLKSQLAEMQQKNAVGFGMR